MAIVLALREGFHVYCMYVFVACLFCHSQTVACKRDQILLSSYVIGVTSK